MSLRKWMKLFGTTILIGGFISAVAGVVMASLDPGFTIPNADDWLYNMLTMFLSGLTLGAFAHMGFFAYLTLNYIAKSIFRRPYLWVALQGFVTLFVLVEIMVNLYDTHFPKATFWVLPLTLIAASALVSWRKTKETSAGAWIPSLFFMIVITVLEGNPAFRQGSLASLAYMLLPLFVCNAYQLMQLHRILKTPGQRTQLAEAG